MAGGSTSSEMRSLFPSASAATGRAARGRRSGGGVAIAVVALGTRLALGTGGALGARLALRPGFAVWTLLALAARRLGLADLGLLGVAIALAVVPSPSLS
jgi:hypothetical protein